MTIKQLTPEWTENLVSTHNHTVDRWVKKNKTIGEAYAEANREAAQTIKSLVADFAERITPEKKPVDMTALLNGNTQAAANSTHNTCVDLITQNIKAELGDTPKELK